MLVWPRGASKPRIVRHVEQPAWPVRPACGCGKDDLVTDRGRCRRKSGQVDARARIGGVHPAPRHRQQRRGQPSGEREELSEGHEVHLVIKRFHATVRCQEEQAVEDGPVSRADPETAGGQPGLAGNHRLNVPPKFFPPRRIKRQYGLGPDHQFRRRGRRGDPGSVHVLPDIFAVPAGVETGCLRHVALNDSDHRSLTEIESPHVVAQEAEKEDGRQRRGQQQPQPHAAVGSSGGSQRREHGHCPEAVRADPRRGLHRRDGKCPDLTGEVPREAGQQPASEAFGKHPGHAKGDQSPLRLVEQSRSGHGRRGQHREARREPRHADASGDPSELPRVDERRANPVEPGSELPESKCPARPERPVNPAAADEPGKEGKGHPQNGECVDRCKRQCGYRPGHHR